MKIEYIAEGDVDCPLIRLFEFDKQDVVCLHEQTTALANGSQTSLDCRASGNCRLVLEPSKRDEGVVQIGPDSFRWTLSACAWDNVAFLIEPFLRDDLAVTAFQWLDSFAGQSEIHVLLSKDGKW